MNMLKILAELQRLRHKAHPHIAFNYVDVSQLIHIEDGPFDGPGMSHGVAVRGAKTVERTEAIRLSAAVTATDNSPVVIATLHRTECRLIEQLTANAKGKVTVTMAFNGWDGAVPKSNRVEVWVAYMRVSVDDEAQHNTTVNKDQAITRADVYHPCDCQRDDPIWANYVMTLVQQQRAAFHAVPREDQTPYPIDVQGAEYGSIVFTTGSMQSAERHAELILRAEERHHLMKGLPQQSLNYMWHCTINDAVGEATWRAACDATRQCKNVPNPEQPDDASAINERLRVPHADERMRIAIDDDPFCDATYFYYPLGSHYSSAPDCQTHALSCTIPLPDTNPSDIAVRLYKEQRAWRNAHPNTRHSPIVWRLNRGVVRTYTARFYVEVNNAQEQQ